VDLEKYIIETDEDSLSYSFYSKGPKGIIKKVVRFKLVSDQQYDYFNLAFGDWNELEGEIDDIIISNNKDTEKVLSTVAAIIVDFCNRHPETFISVEASTESRLRLYQIKINKYWEEIDSNFEIYGYIEGKGLSAYYPGIKCLLFVGRKRLK
jgi:hypothetical protein